MVDTLICRARILIFSSSSSLLSALPVDRRASEVWSSSSLTPAAAAAAAAPGCRPAESEVFDRTRVLAAAGSCTVRGSAVVVRRASVAGVEREVCPDCCCGCWLVVVEVDLLLFDESLCTSTRTCWWTATRPARPRSVLLALTAPRLFDAMSCCSLTAVQSSKASAHVEDGPPRCCCCWRGVTLVGRALAARPCVRVRLAADVGIASSARIKTLQDVYLRRLSSRADDSLPRTRICYHCRQV